MRLWLRPRAPFWRLFVWVSAGVWLLVLSIRTVTQFWTVEWVDAVRWTLACLFIAVLYERTEKR